MTGSVTSAFQFKSYLESLVVMIAIPFAFIGVIRGHLLMGLELSMPGMEAVFMMTVADFPAFIIVDDKGTIFTVISFDP